MHLQQFQPHSKYATARANVEAMKQAGVNSIWYESPNAGHDCITWRRSLIQLAPLLFQD